MNGTEKQVAWAQDIVRTTIAQIAPVLPALIQQLQSDLSRRSSWGRDTTVDWARLQAAETLILRLQALDNARNIIDMRHHLVAPNPDQFLVGQAMSEEYRARAYQEELERLAMELIISASGTGPWSPLRELLHGN